MTNFLKIRRKLLKSNIRQHTKANCESKFWG